MSARSVRRQYNGVRMSPPASHPRLRHLKDLSKHEQKTMAGVSSPPTVRHPKRHSSAPPPKRFDVGMPLHTNFKEVSIAKAGAQAVEDDLGVRLVHNFSKEAIHAASHHAVQHPRARLGRKHAQGRCLRLWVFPHALRQACRMLKRDAEVGSRTPAKPVAHRRHESAILEDCGVGPMHSQGKALGTAALRAAGMLMRGAAGHGATRRDPTTPTSDTMPGHRACMGAAKMRATRMCSANSIVPSSGKSCAVHVATETA